MFFLFSCVHLVLIYISFLRLTEGNINILIRGAFQSEIKNVTLLIFAKLIIPKIFSTRDRLHSISVICCGKKKSVYVRPEDPICLILICLPILHIIAVPLFPPPPRKLYYENTPEHFYSLIFSHLNVQHYKMAHHVWEKKGTAKELQVKKIKIPFYPYLDFYTPSFRKRKKKKRLKSILRQRFKN